VGEVIERAAEAAGGELDGFGGKLRTWFHDWAAEGFVSAVERAD
jgi:hypothetical protein